MSEEWAKLKAAGAELAAALYDASTVLCVIFLIGFVVGRCSA